MASESINQAVFRRSRCLLACVLVIAESGLAFGAETAAVDPAWLHLYVRNRRQSVALETATELAEQGRIPEFTPQLQWLLDQPHDSWVTDDEGQLFSIRGTAESLFQAQGQSAFDHYRRTIGPTAALELARIASSPESTGLFAIVRRYAATEAGQQAADRLVARWLDEGAWQRAAELGIRILRDERHEKAMPADFVRRVWLACRLAGRDHDVAFLTERFSRFQFDTGEPSVMTERWQWLGPGGDPVRNATTEASPPLLIAEWQHRLSAPAAHPKAVEITGRWMRTQQEQDQPTAVGWTPVLAANHVVFRDFDSIQALDAATGQPRWRYRTGSGLASLLSLSIDQRTLLASDYGALMRRQDGPRWDMALANSLLSGISTDGRRVYAIDQYEPFLQATVGGMNPAELASAVRKEAARNALIALDLVGENDEERLVWSTAAGALRETWASHAFLGPPLPYEGWLYAISERDREICLSAIDAATGQPFWQQPIAEVERSVIEDRGRNLRACSPSVVNGLVLCPTNIGLLVAVDALTGELRWAHNALTSDEREPRGGVRFRTQTAVPQRRHSAFAPLVHVVGDRAVYMPSHQTKAYCLSVSDGQVLWSADAKDAEYIGALTDSQVLIVGKSSCRGLSLSDGDEQWKQTLTAAPSGFGLSRGPSYLLPLGDGRIVELDLQTGDALGYQFRTAPEPLGHLLATRETVLSIGSTGVTAYPQTSAVRRQLQLEQATKPTQSLRLAEILLTEGNLTAAIRELETSRETLRDQKLIADAESLLRKSYIQALADDEAAVDHWLAKLKPLCRTPEDRMLWLVSATDRALSQGRMSELPPLLSEVASLNDVQGVTATPKEPGLAVAPRVWLRMLIHRAERDEQASSLKSELLAALPDHDEAARTSAAYAVDGAEWAAEARWHLAGAARERGDWHQAECLLLRDVSGTGAAAARATVELAKLYEAAGLLSSAGPLLDSLSTRFAQETGADGVPYGEVIQNWPRERGAYAAWRKRQPLSRAVGRAVIAARPGDERAFSSLPEVAGVVTDDTRYAGFHRPVLAPPRPEAALDWLMQHRDPHVVYGVFDRCSAQKIAEYELPLGTQAPYAFLPQSAGSGLTFGLPGELRMLSPLQGSSEGRAWSATLPDWNGRGTAPQSGPSSPRFVFFQLKNELIAVDSADGAVLWRRSDLPSGSGLFADARNGLTADDEFVVLLEPQRQGYRVFEAPTGRLHRQGPLPAGIRFPGQARGRLMVYQTPDALPKLRVWDPATDTLLLETPLRPQPMMDLSHPEQVSWLTPNHRLCVFDYAAQRTVIDVPLSEKDMERRITSLKCFRQGGRYFAALGSDQPTARTEHFHSALQESLIPVVSLRDELLAIDGASQKILWQRPQPYCSIVQWGDLPVPVLVAISTIRDKRNPNRRWLQMQAIDPASGFLLGASGELPLDAIMAADYDGTTGSIRLLGRRTTYELQLRPAAPQRDLWPPTL